MLAIGCEAVVKKVGLTSARKSFRLYREQAHSYKKSAPIQVSILCLMRVVEGYDRDCISIAFIPRNNPQHRFASLMAADIGQQYVKRTVR